MLSSSDAADGIHPVTSTGLLGAATAHEVAGGFCEEDGDAELEIAVDPIESTIDMVTRQLSEPRAANWIASEAAWSHEPTKRVLERLVDDGIPHRDDSGNPYDVLSRLPPPSTAGGDAPTG